MRVGAAADAVATVEDKMNGIESNQVWQVEFLNACILAI